MIHNAQSRVREAVAFLHAQNNFPAPRWLRDRLKTSKGKATHARHARPQIHAAKPKGKATGRPKRHFSPRRSSGR